MITNKTALDIQGIVRLGASVDVTAKQLSALDLQGIARLLQDGATLTVHDSDMLSALDMQGIARAKRGQVHFK